MPNLPQRFEAVTASLPEPSHDQVCAVCRLPTAKGGIETLPSSTGSKAPSTSPSMLKTTQYRLRSEIASGKIARQPALTSSQAQRQQSFATFRRFKNSLLNTKESQALLSE